MEPIAIVTALLGVLIILSRAPLVVSPIATLSVYRRLLATRSRIRTIGALLALLAVALIVTAREARADHGGVAVAVECLGWVIAAAALWLGSAPAAYQRLAYSILDSVSDPALMRAMGAFASALGLGLVWLAFFLL